MPDRYQELAQALRDEGHEEQKVRRIVRAVGPGRQPRRVLLSEHEARVDEAPQRGEVLVTEGRVLDTEGRSVAGALVDVWHANEKGHYSHFDPDQKDFALRRKIRTGADGSYRFRSFVPPGYTILPNSPDLGTVQRAGPPRQPPAHIHFLVAAEGQCTLTTQVNIPGDTFLDDDFATRDGLVVTLEPNTAPAGHESLDVREPFTRVRFDFVMQKTSSDDESRPAAWMERVAA